MPAVSNGSTFRATHPIPTRNKKTLPHPLIGAIDFATRNFEKQGRTKQWWRAGLTAFAQSLASKVSGTRSLELNLRRHREEIYLINSAAAF
jgi:hypothetical protein